MAAQQQPVQIRYQDVSSIKNITLEPFVNPQYQNLYVKLTAIHDQFSNKRKFKTRYIGESKEDELSFFYKLNHLLYELEKKNIQDIIHLRGINGDIYNVLNYLFKKYKNKQDKLRIILDFIKKHFNLTWA